MADVREADRLQPSLLDRLTDDAPDERTETRDKRVIDVRRLREIIQRDLSFLLNTTSKDDVWPLSELPNVARSVLNYGVIEIAGRRAQEARLRELEGYIRTAIEVFEPRILPGTLSVTLSAEKARSRSVLAFDIKGEIWAEPLPLEIYMRTEVDVTSGDMTVARRG
jgi:type VI secretion system protein ImpF